jgi:hypothetical protein
MELREMLTTTTQTGAQADALEILSTVPPQTELQVRRLLQRFAMPPAMAAAVAALAYATGARA